MGFTNTTATLGTQLNTAGARKEQKKGQARQATFEAEMLAQMGRQLEQLAYQSQRLADQTALLTEIRDLLAVQQPTS